MDVSFPIEGVTSEEQLFEMTETGTDGFFPVGGNGFWHGGVHLRTTQPLVAVKGGVLVAYRINKLPLTVRLGDERLEYSTGFVLLRHEAQTPLGHKATFYSLTMHVLPWLAYREDPSLLPPSFLSEPRPKRIKTDRDGRGVKLLADASPTTVLGILPRGTICAPVPGAVPADHWSKSAEHRGVIRVRWNELEGWAKLDRSTSREERTSLWVTTAAVTVWQAEDASHALGMIPAGAMFNAVRERPRHETWRAHPRRDELYKVSHGELQGYADLKDLALAATLRVTGSADAPSDATKLGLAVRERGEESACVLRILPKGTYPRFKEPLAVKRLDGRYYALAEGGFILVDGTTMEMGEAIREPEKYDEVVLGRNLPVERGARLGYAGTFLRAITGEPVAASPSASSVAHFEIFSADANFAANPHNEHWFGTKFRIAPGTTFKRRACAPDALPPPVAVDLREGDVLRRVRQNSGSTYAQYFRHQVFGWKRLSELGDIRPIGYTFRNYPNKLFKDAPACWCEEPGAETVEWMSVRGDYLDTVGFCAVHETFKLVHYRNEEGSSTRGVEGWAREHALGDFHAQAYRPAAAVSSAVATRPAQWLPSTPTLVAVTIPGNRYLRHEEEHQVTEVFRRVRLGTEVGWAPKTLLGVLDPRGGVYRPSSPVPFLPTVPTTSVVLRSGRTIPAGSELEDDGGAETSVEEPWIQVFFRNDAGEEVRAWARKAELGTIEAANIFVLTRELPALLNERPVNEVNEEKNNTRINAAAGSVLEFLGQSKTVARSYQKVQQHRGTGVGWLRAEALRNNFTSAPHHARLAADVSSLFRSAPNQVELAASVGAEVTILSEADVDGLAYLEVSFRGRRGWCPREEVGAVDRGRCTLTSELRWVLRDRPATSPEQVSVTARSGDALVIHDEKGAFAKVEVIVSVNDERCHGWYFTQDVPGSKARRTLTEAFTDDPDSAFTVDAGVNSTLVEIEATTAPLVRTQNGHGWHEFEFQPGTRGWINLHLDLTSRRFVGNGVSAVSVYDWEGWQKIQEEGAEARFSDDGLCDVPTLVNLLEKDERGAKRDSTATVGRLTNRAIQHALAQPQVKKKLRSLVCLHPSEWDSNGDWEARFRRLKMAPWELDEADYRATLDYIRKLEFWRGAFGETGTAAPPSKAWHWHPINVLSQWRKMRGITAEQLKRIVPRARLEHIERYVGWLNVAMERYEITTPLLQAHFLAQVAHESAYFRCAEEEASGIDYDARFDLNNIRPEDGRTFKGRGLIQVTGRENYSLYGAYVGEDFTTNPSRLAEPRFASDSAGWFWSMHGLNTVAARADDDTVRELTRKINGGLNGIDERLMLFHEAKRVLLDRS